MKRTTSEELLDTPKSLLVVSTDFDEEKYETFVANVRLKLSDVRLCRLEDGLYVSLMSVVSLKDFVIYRGEYCKRCHNSHCTECIVLINMASYILKEGVAKVSEVFKMQFPNKIYKSDKAVQRLLQLPVVIVKGEFLFVTEKRPDVNYKILLELLPKMLPAEKEVGSRISKETLRTLCQLASTESDRKLLKYIATWGQSAKQAKLAYGIDDNVRKVQQVNQAMLMANEIQKSVMELATLEDTALLNSVLLNRDDQAGFRLDTTFTHKQGKCITLESQPSLTTRTDFVNKYPSLLQTTSYLFLDSETTEKACVGIVKPHFTYDKTPTQHYIDLNMLETKLPNYLIEKPIDCIRVDGAGDEGPAHLEVQFLWTERHILKQKICTIITTRNSGGSYLNPVELMNGCIAKAHANLYIPSTLAGGNFSGSGLDADKLTENMDLATDVYIDRVNGAPCCGTNIQLFKGGKDPSLVERREALLIFLRGNPKKKDELKAASPTLYQHFERVWSVRQSHMDHKVPAQYAFILTLCYKPECSHPLCHGATREQCWFENGPPLSYIPFPIPDPERPWGGSCEECSGMCSGHYLKPLAHWGYVKDRAYDTAEFQYKPPSAVIKERFYDSLKQGKEMLNIDLESVAKQVLLSVDEVSMQVEHLKGTMERRKMGAQKAALTRKNKKAVSKCLIMLILRLKQVTYS